jgi:hypothetical protein
MNALAHEQDFAGIQEVGANERDRNGRVAYHRARNLALPRTG